MTANIARLRRRRCVQSVPANRPRFVRSAAASQVDEVFLDLEDSVPESEKRSAREQAIRAVNETDWGNKTIAIRINGLDSPHMHRDVIDVVEACPRLDTILVPKVSCAGDVHMVDVLLNQVEASLCREHPVGIELLIESAPGITYLNEIVSHSSRAEAVVFGLADYAASTGARTLSIGAPLSDYAILSDSTETAEPQNFLSDAWHYPRSKILVACRTYGLQAIDGAYGHTADGAGLVSTAKMASSIGYDGKLAIHPNQIADILDAFTPSDAEVAAARQIIQAMRQVSREGGGSASSKGSMIDVASLRMAERVLLLSAGGSDLTGAD